MSEKKSSWYYIAPDVAIVAEESDERIIAYVQFFAPGMTFDIYVENDGFIGDIYAGD